MEVWKDIKDFEGLYMISDLGNVKSFYRNKLLKLKKDKDGYSHINLYKNKKQYTLKVHRLVAQAFIPNVNNYKEINHKDENKANNVVDNLEWCTRKYNNNYNNKNQSISKRFNQYDLDGNFIATYNSTMEATRKLGISRNISSCCLGKLKSCGGYIWRYA